MSSLNLKEAVKNIRHFGKLLWDKDLVTGQNGNISCRLGEDDCLITATATCKGFLRNGDIVRLSLDGNVRGAGQVSTEWRLHADIYRNFPDVQSVIHTHTCYVNAFFLKNTVFKPETFEAEHYLGSVPSVDQDAVNVKNTAPVLSKMRKSKIVVLRRHGVVSAGKDLFECFMRIQVLEEQIKVAALKKLFARRAS